MKPRSRLCQHRQEIRILSSPTVGDLIWKLRQRRPTPGKEVPPKSRSEKRTEKGTHSSLRQNGNTGPADSGFEHRQAGGDAVQMWRCTNVILSSLIFEQRVSRLRLIRRHDSSPEFSLWSKMTFDLLHDKDAPSKTDTRLYVQTPASMKLNLQMERNNEILKKIVYLQIGKTRQKIQNKLSKNISADISKHRKYSSSMPVQGNETEIPFSCVLKGCFTG